MCTFGVNKNSCVRVRRLFCTENREQLNNELPAKYWRTVPEDLRRAAVVFVQHFFAAVQANKRTANHKTDSLLDVLFDPALQQLI